MWKRTSIVLSGAALFAALGTGAGFATLHNGSAAPAMPSATTSLLVKATETPSATATTATVTTSSPVAVVTDQAAPEAPAAAVPACTTYVFRNGMCLDGPRVVNGVDSILSDQGVEACEAAGGHYAARGCVVAPGPVAPKPSPSSIPCQGDRSICYPSAPVTATTAAVK